LCAGVAIITSGVIGLVGEIASSGGGVALTKLLALAGKSANSLIESYA